MGKATRAFWESLSPVEQMRHGHCASDHDDEYADLRARRLPVPQPGVPQIAAERLDLSALWRSLSDADRERVGLIGLGLVFGGTMAMEAEQTAPAASRAALGFYHAVEEDLAMMDVPEAIVAAMRGPSWRIPSGHGPVCLSCGCSEADACPDGCGWADESQTVCTECAAPRLRFPAPAPADLDDCPF